MLFYFLLFESIFHTQNYDIKENAPNENKKSFKFILYFSCKSYNAFFNVLKSAQLGAFFTFFEKIIF